MTKDGLNPCRNKAKKTMLFVLQERLLDLVIATRENTSKLGYFVDDTVVNPGLGIPYYKTVEALEYEVALDVLWIFIVLFYSFSCF